MVNVLSCSVTQCHCCCVYICVADALICTINSTFCGWCRLWLVGVVWQWSQSARQVWLILASATGLVALLQIGSITATMVLIASSPLILFLHLLQKRTWLQIGTVYWLCVCITEELISLLCYWQDTVTVTCWLIMLGSCVIRRLQQATAVKYISRQTIWVCR